LFLTQASVHQCVSVVVRGPIRSRLTWVRFSRQVRPKNLKVIHSSLFDVQRLM